ncbi:PQQ-binding-like beta-propeller repeat protein [Natrinema zhouii]|uniref:PQQ-binding-like beta-propeller repeat protein n=1 Tax=Natrinema zhouii TaxID=1710539 RepID=A0A7D6CRK8_9EURY|nr:PQQ-like beta-propeller repeat protein [Natrinema zhouii]QLK27476.1 PQQ-binding-like beta-propeller repeat protein [Natrinema zhouii]
MEELHRRTLLGTGAALAAGGILTSISTGETGDDCCPQTISEPERSWSSADANPAGGRYVSAETEIEKPETVAWEYDGYGGDLAIADGTVYLRTEENEIHALDDATGEVEWTADEIPVEGSPAVAGGTVYLGGGQLTALDASDGTVQWTRDFGSGPASVSSPTVTYGRVYVVADGTVYAVDPRDGSTDWKLETVDIDVDVPAENQDREFEAVQFKRSFAVANESVYALTEKAVVQKAVVALDARTGDVQWKSTDEVVTHDVNGPVTASETMVYAPGSFRLENTGFDAETGEQVGGGGAVFPTATRGEIDITGTENGIGVDRYDGESSEHLWGVGASTPVLVAGSYAIVGKTVLIETAPTGENSQVLSRVVAYDLETGDERWEILTDGELGVSHIEAVGPDTIYDRDWKTLRALRSSEAQDGDADGDGSDGGDDNDGDQNDGGSDDGSNETDDSNGDGDSSDGGDGSTDTSSGDSDEDTGSDGGDSAGGDDGTAGGSDDGNDTGTADRSDDGADGVDDGSESDDGNGSTEGGADADGDGSGVDSDTDGATDENGSTADGNSSGVDNDTEDSTPGFTPIASLTAGALGLEGLRRRALADDSDGE